MTSETINLLTHEIRQVDHQCQQLREWIAPVLKELEHLKCWRAELVEAREAELRKTARVTRCEPSPGPDQPRKPRKRAAEPVDPMVEKLSKLSAQQMADLMAILESAE